LNYKLGVPSIDDAVGGIGEGTSLLVTGNAPSYSFSHETISESIESDEGTVYVTTERSAREVLEEYEDYDTSRFGVVDCVSESQGLEDTERKEKVRFASSPSDMTGIGIEVSDLLEEFWENRGIERNRVCLESVSTLLMYSNLETVFRFLHVFTGRVRSIDGLGLFFIKPGMHDEKEFSTLRQLFDGRVEIKEDDGSTQIRVSGLTEEPTDWVSVE
jgi:KaiC/GvpD/RAD55 family RecA-like ATPase